MLYYAFVRGVSGGDACSGVCFAGCVWGVHGGELVDCILHRY
jgi:hypothetical protein